MPVEQILAANLSALMGGHPEFASQMKLSKATGVGQTTIGRIRRGEGAATIDNVYKIAKAFNLSASDLLKPTLSKQLASSEQNALLVLQLVNELETGEFSESQLRILQNTIAALKSG
jgi:transcriptional regulator with XRE-family HTH domain